MFRKLLAAISHPVSFFSGGPYRQIIPVMDIPKEFDDLNNERKVISSSFAASERRSNHRDKYERNSSSQKLSKNLKTDSSDWEVIQFLNSLRYNLIENDESNNNNFNGALVIYQKRTLIDDLIHTDSSPLLIVIEGSGLFDPLIIQSEKQRHKIIGSALQSLISLLQNFNSNNNTWQAVEEDDMNLALNGAIAAADIVQNAVCEIVSKESSTQYAYIYFEEYLLPMKDLFIALEKLGFLIGFSASKQSQALWCQCLYKSSLMLHLLSCQFIRHSTLLPFQPLSQLPPNNNHKSVKFTNYQIFQSLLHSLRILTGSIVLANQIGGSSLSQATRMMFWVVCETLSTYSLNKSKTNHPLEVQVEDLSNPIINYSQVISQIYHSFVVTSPAPQELFMSINKNYNYHHRRDSGILNNNNNNILLNTSVFGLKLSSYMELKLNLIGFQFLLQFASHEHKDLSIHLARHDDWINSLLEALIVILKYDIRSESPASISSYILELLIFLLHRSECANNLYGGAFLELAMCLDKFTEKWKQRKRFIPSRINPSKRLKSVSSSSLDLEESGDCDLMGSTGSLNFSFNFNMTTSTIATAATPDNIRDHQNNNSYRSQRSSSRVLLSPAQSFTIGDSVDGLCLLPNGSQRWFPGEVIGLGAKGTYQVKYKDGEIQNNKNLNELRNTKRRELHRAISSSESTVEQGQGGLSSQNSSVATKPLYSATTTMTTNTPSIHSHQVMAQLPTGIIATGGTSSLNNSFGIPRHPSAFMSSPQPSFYQKIIHSEVVSPSHPFQTILGVAEKATVRPFESPRSIVSNSSDDSDNVFEIPSVFGDDISRKSTRCFTNNNQPVPKIHFNDMDLSSHGASGGGGNSLSSSLVRDPSSMLDYMATAGESSNLLDAWIVPRDDGTTSRLGTWRDDSAKVTGRSSTSRRNANSRRISMNSADSSFPVGGDAMRRARAISSGGNGGVGGGGIGIIDYMGNSYNNSLTEDRFDDIVFEELIPTYAMIAALLLERCVVSGLFLDLSYCMADSTGSMDSNTINKLRAESSVSSSTRPVNILFTVRDFLDCVAGRSLLPHLAGIISLNSRAGSRLLKLLSGTSFNSCLPYHTNDTERIADGGFGSIFRVKCPVDCHSHCSHNLPLFSDTTTTPFSLNTSTCYAIKRIPRERSSHDNPIIVDIFYEVSCLELLIGQVGICQLFDYGVFGGEYWLVMEEGGMNLEEWRLMNENQVVDILDLELYMYIYYDIVLIMTSVHSHDIIHFDLKLNNLILKKQESYSELKNQLQKHFQSQPTTPSGLLFLADFGESIPNASILLQNISTYHHVMKIRSRGTLPIQSPEMLELTESETKYEKPKGGLGLSDKNNNNLLPPHRVLPDFSSDIWSLGCLLVQLITGDYLFANKSWAELYVMLCLDKLCTLPFELFRQTLANTNPTIVSVIESLVVRCLRRKTNERASLNELRSSLEKFLLKKSYWEEVNQRMEVEEIEDDLDEEKSTTGRPHNNAATTETGRNCHTRTTSHYEKSNLDDNNDTNDRYSNHNSSSLNEEEDTQKDTVPTAPLTDSSPVTPTVDNLHESITVPCGLWDWGNNVYLNITSRGNESSYNGCSRRGSLSLPSLLPLAQCTPPDLNILSNDIDVAIKVAGLARSVALLAHRRLKVLRTNSNHITEVILNEDDENTMINMIVDNNKNIILPVNKDILMHNSNMPLSNIISNLIQTHEICKNNLNNNNDGAIVITIRSQYLSGMDRDFAEDCITSKLALSIAISLIYSLITPRQYQKDCMSCSHELPSLECIDRIAPWISVHCNKSFIATLTSSIS